MRPLHVALIITFLFGTLGCKNISSRKTQEIKNHVPSIDEVSGIWMASDTMAIEPSIRNFRGQALLNRDLTSVSWFVSAPYSGGHHTGTLKINGKVPEASHFRWQPYQALRKGTLDGLEIQSSTRMLVENNAIMWEIEITNNDNTEKGVKIDLDMIGYIDQYKDGNWNWWYPYPDWSGKRSEHRNDALEAMRKHITSNDKDIDKNWPSDNEILNTPHFSAQKEAQNIYIQGKNTPAISSYTVVTTADSLSIHNSGGVAHWQLKLASGTSKKIKYFLSYGDNIDTIKTQTKHWSKNFDKEFASVKTKWEDKWENLFKPNNDLVSGCFPVLETNDEKAKKVYYTGPLTLLYLMNTNLPEHKRVYLTGGPRWGASTTFYWDIAIWSELWAVVDPEMMKEHIMAWTDINPNLHYGKDNLSGHGVGNGYSANYWCLFRIIRAYITTTGDYEFLDKKIAGKTVMEHLESYALNWQNLSSYGKQGYENELYQLADFGPNPWNLLECVPTYVHIVPSFNIGYVWMMRETSALYKQKGNLAKATDLAERANEMTKKILKLYAGKGVWNSLYPNNKTVEVRHVLDFIYFGKYLANDVSVDIRNEMMDFLNTELRTDLWMRAQSLKDIASKDSDRPDHGPLGSFDGWVPEVMDAMTNMEYANDALSFYHDIEPVTFEGCWAQARELWGDNKFTKSARVRIAERGWNNRESSSGIGISQVMLKNFFGFNPQIDGKVIQSYNIWPFSKSGTLHHVYYKNDYYRIEFSNDKPVMIKEDP
ncbi:hypothetical protein [Seonamhaeicola aphaedonensis]|uniref:Alpha-L-rhamnosidase six-hairpin glycosidase domain-containing protein n=1 Tax=Seonamhaeicola aphaedonensis TaxID=1461338 RepID=A0A3D9HDF0_9FLAO|nr:hypothetical protein [Seonamhaeicola aphaedonensis]RED47507.1 hypothetical protein DFQ02_106134 [Seonamhaeicola aphaedonensis]